MNLQKVVVLCVLLALMGGLGWYLSNKDTKPSVRDRETDTVAEQTNLDQTDTERETLSGLGSFTELMALGKNLTCDFSYVSADTNGAVAGTIYIAGERMRGDFDMEQAGQLFESHMIDDSEYVYSWSVTPQGTFAFRAPVEEGESDSDMVTSDADLSTRSVDMDHEVDYDCESWRVDESVFTPPADVEFLSPEDMFLGIPVSQ